MLKEEVRIMFDHRESALDDIDAELGRLIEYANDQLYDEEGEFQHEWTDCDKIRWSRVLTTLSDAGTGIFAIRMNTRGRA